MPRDITILHAPSPLGLMPPAEGRVPGVRRMPEALRGAGLHAALGATFAGEVTPPPYVPDRDPELNVRNLRAVAAYSVELADAVGRLLDAPGLPLVLGGDCSIFLGAALALRRRGRFGVVYLDAHSDCQTPEISGTGGIAGMPLAIATGRGPGLLTGLEGRGPYVAEEDAVLVGCRDLFDVVGTREKRVEGTGIRVHDLEEVRRAGPERVAEGALERLAAAGVDGVWLHLDADVLDPAVMPAVDSPDPGGLSAEELVRLLAPLLASPRVVGMQMTIYDPERDPDGSAAAVLVDVVTEAVARTRGA
jgi:arginase